jgi:hypothetical protein
VKITVSINRFGDVGQAGCSIELEIDQPRGTGPAEKADRVKIRDRIRRAYALADEAVAEQLGRMEAITITPEREPGSDDDLEPAPVNGHGKARHDWPSRRPGPGPSDRPPGTDRPAPRTGKALFAFLKDEGTKHNFDLVKYMSAWAKLQSFPYRMVDYDVDQIGDAHVEACRKLAEIAAAPEELREEARP